jgi:hypothetical protein
LPGIRPLRTADGGDSDAWRNVARRAGQWNAPRLNFSDFGVDTVVKYCKSCWRREHHVFVRGNFLFGILLAGTLGIAWFFRPKRCVCCGNLRIL